MVISDTHKYIFVGLPFSASSAISRELMYNYKGAPLYHKHANIPLLLKLKPEVDLKQYFVFAVARDPQDILFSSYNKFLTNPYNKFTDAKFFTENGGFVPKRDRDFYELMKAGNWSFNEFLKKKYPSFPYDNNLSINRGYLNGVIQFDNLADDFDKILKSIGITPLRVLPLYNQTKKVADAVKVSDQVQKITAPFLDYNKKFFPELKAKINVNILQKLKFLLLHKARLRKINAYDMLQHNNSFSMEDLKNER